MRAVCLRFAPAACPPLGGTHHLVGDCFLEPPKLYRGWRGGYGMFLLHDFTGARECELIVGAGDPRFQYDGQGNQTDQEADGRDHADCFRTVFD